MLKHGNKIFLPLIFLGATPLWAEVGASTVTQEQITIAAVMVQFQQDTTSGTAGDGTFVLDPDYGIICSDFAMDPPPHDAAYFWDHLRAANIYWDRVSDHAVTIDLDASYLSNHVYTLPHEMSYYHPFDQAFDLTEKLSEFTADVVSVVGSDINFSAYNTVVIFHAGLGGDFDFALDPTPGNLPSAFLTQAEMAQVGFNLPVPNVLIIPESQNMLHFPETRELFIDSDNPCFFQFGLNGTFALMMGFRLGLPPMYNTETGQALVGKFGLMDQGAANVQGIAPAWPNPYSRMLQGWTSSVPIYVGDTLQVGVDEAPLQFTISPGESYLIENKERNLHQSPPGYTEWIVNDDTVGVVIASSGVVLSTDDADAGYPGNGLLIWHIDENAIHTAENPNAGPTQWIDLVEGDGAQDLGFTTRILFGDFLEQGWWFDPWFAGNDGWFALNRQQLLTPDSLVRFGPDTHPNTRSNTGRPSHLALERISRSGSVMSFSVSSDRLVGNRNLDRIYGVIPSEIPTVLGQIRGSDSLAFFKLNESGSLNLLGNPINSLPGLLNGAIDTTIKFLYPYFVSHQSNGNSFYDIRSGVTFVDHAPMHLDNLAYTDGSISYWGNSADSAYIYQIDTTDNVPIQRYALPDSILGLISQVNVIGPDSLYTAHHIDAENNIDIQGRRLQPVFFRTDNIYSDQNWGHLFINPQGELAFRAANQETYILTSDIPRFVIPLHGDAEEAPEILLLYDNHIRIMNIHGMDFPNSPWSIDSWIGNPLVGWFTGGGLPEIFLRHNNGYSIYNLKGHLVDGGSLMAPDLNQPLSFYVTGATDWQLIAGNNTFLKFAMIDSVKTPLWNSPEGSSEGYRYVVDSQSYSAADVPLMDLATVFNYPNPVHGNTTSFRALLGDVKSWKVDIFAMSGLQIDRLESEIVDINSYNEMVWNTTNVGNGIYLARVESKGLDGSTASKIVKVMVIH